MFKRFSLIALLALFAAMPLQAQEVEVQGVKLPTSIKLAGEELTLNGAGVRTRFMFRVYVGALYLPEKAGDAEQALEMEGPKRVQMTLLRNIDKETLSEAMTDGFAQNLTEEEQQRFQPQIREFAGMLDAGKKGETVQLDMIPGEGVRITHAGRDLGTVEGDEDFHQAVLKLWIGPQPTDGNLKKSMLGN